MCVNSVLQEPIALFLSVMFGYGRRPSPAAETRTYGNNAFNGSNFGCNNVTTNNVQYVEKRTATKLIKRTLALTRARNIDEQKGNSKPYA